MKTKIHIITIITAIIGMVITAAITIIAANWSKREILAEFKLDVDTRVSWIENELNLNEEILYGLKGLYESSEEVNRNEFRAYADLMLKRHLEIQALEWVPYVPHSNRGQFETGIRNKGFVNFQITERLKQGEMVRANNRDEYFPVTFIEPFEGNQSAFGFDLASNSARFEALNISRKNRKLVATESITLVQGKAEGKAFLVFQPIYKKLSKTVTDNSDNLLGFVIGVFKINDIFKVVTDKTQGKALGIDTEIRDITDPDREKILHHHASLTGTHLLKDISYHKTIDNVGGRKWQVTAHPTKDYINARKSRRPITILIGSLLFTTLLTLYMQNRAKQTEKVVQLVNLRTAELRASETRTSTIVENINSGIVTINEQGTIESANSAVENLFGYYVHDLIGKNIKILLTDSGSKYIKNYIQSGLPKIIGKAKDDLKGKRNDGSIFPIYLAINQFMLRDKRMFTGIITNITEQKRYENQLKEEREKAESATKAKSDFLAVMSHEIRTPMNAIIGIGELLEETSLTKEQMKYVNTFRNAGENLLYIINDILDFSKIESKNLKLEKTPFSLNELMEYIGDVMSFSSNEKKLELIVSILPGTPGYLIGDPVRLRQVFINLVGNSIKFTEKGEIVVTASGENIDESSAQINFTVRDTGIGIPKDKQETIFESFSQADSSTTRKYGGTGLGLAITQRMVNLMGGMISVKSAENMGSTFSFSIQLPIDNEPGKHLDSYKPDLKEQSVLVVDDNDVNRMVLGKTLSVLGCDITECANGEECFTELKNAQKRNQQYSLIFLDYEMPVMDGITVAKKIKEDGICSTPIIILTSSDLREEKTTLTVELGIACYLNKPVKQTELFEIIGTVLLNNNIKDKKDPEKPNLLIERELNILLAEDNPDNRMLICAYLKKSSCKIDIAENGEIAVEKFKANKYDIVLMDIEMPKMNGYTATKIIRQWEKEKGLAPMPIVALSAHALKEHEQKSKDAGCNGHITKPIKKLSLLQALKDYTKC